MTKALGSRKVFAIAALLFGIATFFNVNSGQRLAGGMSLTLDPVQSSTFDAQERRDQKPEVRPAGGSAARLLY